jgi:hypothetical protein
MLAQIQILNMAIFQHKHKEIGSNLFLNVIVETSMLSLSFYELNTNFENFRIIKVGNN